MHPYLPKLKSGTENKFTRPDKAGVWDGHPNSHLASLAEAIEVPPESGRIYSIPDPWARALLFDHALFDERHPLHAMILGEWRGALAMLALKERRGFDALSVRGVSLANAAPGSFRSVASRLKPDNPADFLSDDTTWNEFFIVRWQQRQQRPRAFAFTSPMTLLCTGAEYSTVLPATGEIPWFNGITLRDPIAVLSPKERQALAEWVLAVRKELAMQQSASGRRNQVQNLLEEFAEQLAPEARADTATSTLSNASMGLHTGIFRVLDRPLAPDARQDSDVEILTSRLGAPRYLLIEPSLDKQWNTPAREILVQGDVTLATAGRLTASGGTSGKLGSTNWCTAAFFFAERLIFEQGGTEAFPGCLRMNVTGDARKRSAVFPLNPALLELYTPEELAEMVTLEWLPDGGARCHIRVRLRSASGRERVCVLQKQYADGSAGQMTRVVQLPLICIWPNFRLKGVEWKTYFTFEFWQRETKKELVVRPWSATEPLAAAMREHDLDDRRFHVSRSNAYPEALICETPYFDEARMRNLSATGLLLVKQPAPVTPSGTSEIIFGVDFGSTGSNLYWRRGAADPEPVKFRDRLHRITDFDKNELKRVSYRLFIPAEERSAESILSIFHDFGDPDSGENQRLVLRDGHVLFVDEPERFIEGDRNRIKGNLKWGGLRERIAARDFLMQICLQGATEAAYEGAKTIDLRFSYPTAFSKQDRRRFGGYWKAVADEVSALTGLKLELNKAIDSREAVVATRFFSHEVANDRPMDVVGGALTIDIGGGTSDLAIWNDQKLLAHTSVLIAGRDILQAPLRRMPRVLTEIDKNMRIEGLQGQNDAAFNAQLDAIIANHGPALAKALAMKDSLPMVRDLLTLLEVGLSGITYFAGLMVRGLIQKGEFQPGRRIAIFAGGNGSKIFQWCARNNFSSDSDVHDRTTRAFTRGAGLADDYWVEINLSRRPKEEVAFGLVMAKTEDPNRVEATPPVLITGEAFTVAGTKFAWTDTPSSEALRDKRLRVDRSLPMFREFLAAIGRTLDERAAEQLGGQIDSRYVRMAEEIGESARRDGGTAEESVQHEPVFIAALKAYLEGEINAWARRA